jgi:hypothetical protein
MAMMLFIYVITLSEIPLSCCLKVREQMNHESDGKHPCTDSSTIQEFALRD